MIRILIIDDHAIIRKGLLEILKHEFHDAVFEEAASAEEATNRIITTEYSVIICDLVMPGRSGLDVVAEVRQRYPQVPVLILSLHPEEQYAVRALKAGAAGYVNKVIAASELVKAVKMVLQGHKYISPYIAEKLIEDLNQDPDRNPHERLSNREFYVFKLLAQGRSVSQISGILSLSTTTISTYRARVLNKMDMKTNAQLTRYALEHKII